MPHPIKNISGIWYLYILVALLEFILFQSHVLKNITPFYPTNFDQSSYLPYTYGFYENIKHSGLLLGFKNTPSLATGFLFPIQATLFYLAFGASRFISLLPNFIYFIILQAFALIAARGISQKLYFSLFILGMILSIKTPFLNAGGLMDFRIDFIAFCLYGIILCSAIKSRFFFDNKWSIITGLFATFLILLRCITIIYLLGIFGLMTIYLFYKLKKSAHNSADFFQYKIRFKNCFILTGFITLIGLLYIWANKNALFNYYMIGHLLGNEKNIRASEVGVTNFWSLISFYPTSLFAYHLNQLMFSVSLVSVVGVSLLKIFFNNISKKNNIPWTMGFIFLLLSLLIPLLVLTADVNKSPVVGSIMVMPIILLISWFCLYIDSTCENTRTSKILLNTLGVFILSIGVWNQAYELSHHRSKTQLKSLQTISQMYHDIGQYAVAHHWQEIRLSTDQICDYLTSGGIETLYYETQRILLPVNIERMGGAIFSIKKDEAIASLAKSNIVIFNLNEYANTIPDPFNQSIKRMRPLLKQYTEANFTRLGDYQFMNSTFRVYVAKSKAI